MIKVYINALLYYIKTFFFPLGVTLFLLKKNSETMILSKELRGHRFNFWCFGFILYCAIKKSFPLSYIVISNRQILGYLSTWQYSQPIFVSLGTIIAEKDCKEIKDKKGQTIKTWILQTGKCFLISILYVHLKYFFLVFKLFMVII